jgi:hypothetical protein
LTDVRNDALEGFKVLSALVIEPRQCVGGDLRAFFLEAAALRRFAVKVLSALVIEP